ncbi:MAG: hypothetical protein WCV52_02505, partial [Candidatus Paceibacterota bacterium]
AEVLRNPYPQNIVSAKLSPFIRFVLLDFVQNSFELCPIDTAKIFYYTCYDMFLLGLFVIFIVSPLFLFEIISTLF